MPEEASRPGNAAPGNPADPCHHVRKMCQQLEHTREHLLADVGQVDDPLFKAMFTQASNVLDRLIFAFRSYALQREEGSSTQAEADTPRLHPSESTS